MTDFSKRSWYVLILQQHTSFAQKAKLNTPHLASPNLMPEPINLASDGGASGESGFRLLSRAARHSIDAR
jgi:hypothetical protein